MSTEKAIPIRLLRHQRAYHFLANHTILGTIVGKEILRERGGKEESEQKITDTALAEKFKRHAAHLRGPATKLYQLLASGYGVVKEPARQICECTWGDMPPAMNAQELETYVRDEYTQQGRNIEDIFSTIDFNRQISASFATFVKGELKDRTPVGIKVLYKGIRNVIKKDISDIRKMSWFTSKTGMIPEYAPKILAEIQTRCEEESDPQKEAHNMLLSFTHYTRLFDALRKIDPPSYLRRILTRRLALPPGELNEDYVSTDESMHMMSAYGFIHPLPYTEEAGREDLLTKNILIMDYIPGKPSTYMSTTCPPDIPEDLWQSEMKALAEKNEVLGLVSFHPHTFMNGKDTTTYHVHSDTHPANILCHCSYLHGLCLGLVDFGNVQELTFKDSKNMLELVKIAVEDGYRKTDDGEYTPRNEERLAQAYVRAGIVDTPTNKSLHTHLYPFLERTSRPYRSNEDFDYGSKDYYRKLNTMFWRVQFAPDVNVNEKNAWTHRLLYLHYGAQHRIGQKINSHTLMKELLQLERNNSEV